MGRHTSTKVKAIRIHDFDPGSHEVSHKIFLIVVLGIDCSGQQKLDTLLDRFSASAGGIPPLCWCGRRQL